MQLRIINSNEYIDFVFFFLDNSGSEFGRTMLNVANQALVEKLKKKSESLPASRQKVLSVLLNRLRVEKEQQMLVNLVFICTHNSRRSHIAQLLATILVEHFQIKIFIVTQVVPRQPH